MTAPIVPARLRAASADELVDWDRRTVDAPGGHVLQSRAWADHLSALGWRPSFLVFEDGGCVLGCTRPWPLVGGGGAYVARGPIEVGTIGRGPRLVAVAEALAAEGADVVAADPEVVAGDAAYAAAVRAGGFRPIEELQPSRHRMRLPIAGSDDEEAAFGAIAKSTRQRIRAADRSGLVVIRHDARAGADPGEGFAAPQEPVRAAFDRFDAMLWAVGERRGFRFARGDLLAWWERAFTPGHVILLEARFDGEPLGAMLLYRHGDRLSTVHSADRVETRRTHPGTLHLLRWRSLQLAIREGRAELDLGGVDVPGARRAPVEGEPTWGLYQHKRSFGGEWVELAGAQERVFRPSRYAVGRVARRIGRTIRPRQPATAATAGRVRAGPDTAGGPR